MNKTALRIKLAKLLLKFAQVETDKGILNYEGEFEVGTEVFIEDENGEIVSAPDGDYVYDGKIIVVVDGKVSEIKEPEPEPETQEEQMEEETPVESEPKPNYDEAIMTLSNEIEILKTQIENLQNEIKGIKESAVDTAVEEEFQKTKKETKPSWDRF